MNRVVITGMGVISPLGLDLETTRTALFAGASGIRHIRQFDARQFPVRIAGEVNDPTLPDASAPGLPRMRALAQRAVQSALADAGLPAAAWDAADGVRPDRHPHHALAWSLGKQSLNVAQLADAISGLSHPPQIQAAGWPAEFIQEWEDREPAAWLRELGQATGAAGPAYCCYTACASGNDALGIGKRLIERGEADLVLAGAADSQVQPLSLLEYDLLDALAQGEPEQACRPFDRWRSGFVVGEGAAVLVLESEEHARRRGARLRGRLTGYGSALDCYGLTKCHPEGRGAAQAIEAALADAGRSPAEIGYINAHGTGTVLNDRAESAAIHRVWGARATRIPVSSTKAMTGHLIAAASAVEAVLTLLALQEKVLPPTLNYSVPDPECELAIVRTVQPLEFHIAMSNGFGFGGQNSALILEAA